MFSSLSAQHGEQMSTAQFELIQLDQQLVFRPGDEVNLGLREERREMIYKGSLNKRNGELQVYLFDHGILFTTVLKNKQLQVYGRPIPLELLSITAYEHSNTDEAGTPDVPPVNVTPKTKGQYWINFVHLGRKYYNLVLWADSHSSHKKWLQKIHEQQQVIKDRTSIFKMVSLSAGSFDLPNKVNCTTPYDGGRKIAYGTDDGVYVSDLRGVKKALTLSDVKQIHVLEESRLLIVLSKRQVITFPMVVLDALDPLAGSKCAKSIASDTSLLKVGYCLGRMLVCIVKAGKLSSTFKVLELTHPMVEGDKYTLKIFKASFCKEFYIPIVSTSIHYFKTKLCVGCSRGFEIVELELLETHGLLDPKDESLKFVHKRDHSFPMAIYRIQNEFLLCYNEFAFYIDKNGRRSNEQFMVHWEGTPTEFVLREPFLLAFEPSFVEIWHIATGSLAQVIQGPNLRLLTNTSHSMTESGGSSTQYSTQSSRDEILIGSGDWVFSLRTDSDAITPG